MTPIPDPGATEAAPEPRVVEREVEVESDLGLHARPAATFAETAGRFQAALTVTKCGQEVDARSMLMLLTLDVRRGDRLVLRGTGDDAAEAVEQLAGLVTGG